MTPTPIKRPPQPPTRGMPAWVLLLAFIMLCLGVVLGGLAMWVSVPTLFNQAATQAAWLTVQAERVLAEQALQATQVELDVQGRDLDTRATQAAFALQATGSALNSLAQDLAQTATQSAAQVNATQTSFAVQNAQQMTQVALDYAGTQAALQQDATQAQLSYLATQAYLQTPLPLLSTATASR